MARWIRPGKFIHSMCLDSIYIYSIRIKLINLKYIYLSKPDSVVNDKGKPLLLNQNPARFFFPLKINFCIRLSDVMRHKCSDIICIGVFESIHAKMRHS